MLSPTIISLKWALISPSSKHVLVMTSLRQKPRIKVVWSLEAVCEDRLLVKIGGDREGPNVNFNIDVYIP